MVGKQNHQIDKKINQYKRGTPIRGVWKRKIKNLRSRKKWFLVNATKDN